MVARRAQNSFDFVKTSRNKLIKNETGEYPIVLLDDVFSELDLKRSKKLVSYLNSINISSSNSVQTIITTTDILNIEKSGLILEASGIKNIKLDL